MARGKASGQMGLLDWEPPATTERFADEQVRASTITAKLCRGVATALAEADLSREEIAERMSEFLGKPVSANMLNAYASQAREEHIINAVRFVALIHATGDKRLLEMIAELFGWTVIERRFLKLIEIAALQDHEDTIRKRREALRRDAKAEGIL